MKDDALHAADPASSYREFTPSPPLARALVCTWTQLIVSDGPSDYRHRVLPDGCVDFIWIGSAPPVAVGPATRMFITELPRRTAIVGIRFRPGWAPPGLGAPASELLDREVALRELWGDAADILTDRLLRRPSVAARLAAVEEALLVRCGRDAPDPLVDAAVEWLARHPTGRVDRLARQLGIGERQLHRRFTAAVGYGPKTFQRVARFQRLLAIARRPPGHARASLTELALAAGYADQAHMTREVGALAARTPAAILGQTGSTLAMSDLLGPATVTDTTRDRP